MRRLRGWWRSPASNSRRLEASRTRIPLRAQPTNTSERPGPSYVCWVAGMVELDGGGLPHSLWWRLKEGGEGKSRGVSVHFWILGQGGVIGSVVIARRNSTRWFPWRRSWTTPGRGEWRGKHWHKWPTVQWLSCEGGAQRLTRCPLPQGQQTDPTMRVRACLMGPTCRRKVPLMGCAERLWHVPKSGILVPRAIFHFLFFLFWFPFLKFWNSNSNLVGKFYF
jgi:hypothetical protein